MVHGKSTLIKLLTGIIKPKHGKVLIEGKNTKDKKQEAEIRKDVGLVFQNPENQLVFSNIEDDMKFMLENFGFTKQEINRRINQALELVGMSEYINKETHTLSMGQKQRIAIAEMLALEPKYLVLDEPTAMLDPVSKTKLINTIKNLNKDKEVTVIYATNVISEPKLSLLGKRGRPGFFSRRSAVFSRSS
ncbi:MAG: ATP-binding cassette domain-containing protein, partial [Clostridia bacterium]|nr:ATP-binding cassette domain-containing protein [Clostridia bacterium]